MNRRDHLKTLLLGGAGAVVAPTLPGCRTDGTPAGGVDAAGVVEYDELSYLTAAERRRVEELLAREPLTAHERETLGVLGNLILPPSEHGGIRDAGVVEMIEFRVAEGEDLARSLRGGLAWLDATARARHGGKRFTELAEPEQRGLLDEIAYYDPEVPAAERPMPVNWFSLLRNLVVTGYYTSAAGYADLGYQGNAPNVWDGVPADVLAKHGKAYDPAWIAKCVDQTQRDVQAEWDERGNLLT